MKSPFPGMDPYIEACGLWGDFHHELISEICSKPLTPPLHASEAGWLKQQLQARPSHQ